MVLVARFGMPFEMNSRRKRTLRVLLALIDVAVFAGAFVACDWAADWIRPTLYDLFRPDRDFALQHLPGLYNLLVPGAVLYVLVLAAIGFYLWDWWTPKRLVLGAIVLTFAYGAAYAPLILLFQRESYPLLHAALMLPLLGVMSYLIRLLLTALPGFRSFVDRRYPVVQADGADQPPPAGDDDTKVSLITVHYREPAMWAAFQEYLVARLPKTPFELIVADNSPGHDLAVRPELRPYTTIIPLKNPGFAGGVNAAYAYADGNVIGVFNLDVELDGEVIDRAVARLKGNPKAGVVLPRLNDPDGGRQHSVRRFYDWRTAIYARFPLKSFLPTPKFFRRYLMHDLEVAEPASVDWGFGAAMFIRRESIGGGRVFDPRYFLYFEDVDLCWNMWRRGWQVLYDPRLVCVHHYARASANGFLKPTFFHHVTSFLLFVFKHGGLRRPKADATEVSGSPAD